MEMDDEVVWLGVTAVGHSIGGEAIVKREKFIERVGEIVTCPICMFTLHHPRMFEQCRHILCSECVTQSTSGGKRTCPICRTPFKLTRSVPWLVRDMIQEYLVIVPESAHPKARAG